MDRALQVAAYLAGAVLIVSLISLLLGLAMAARPESFEMLGSIDARRTGLVIALAAGAAIIISGITGRILWLLQRQSEEENGGYS